MARVDEITWADIIHTPRSLLDGYHDQLPVYVLVTKGFCGQNEIETISSNQMARIDSVVEQARVLVEDTKGQYFSIPEDFNIKFDIREKKKIKQKTLRDIIKRYRLPVPVAPGPKTKWYVNVTNKRYSSTSLGSLLVIASYKEKFIRLNTIHDGVIDGTVSLLPVYLDIGMRVAEGVKGNNKAQWRDIVSMYNRAVRQTHFGRIKGPSDILMFASEDLRMHFPGAKYELVMANRRKMDTEGTKNTTLKQATDINSNVSKAPQKQTGAVANGRVPVSVVSSITTDDERSTLTTENAASTNKTTIIRVGGRRGRPASQPSSPHQSRPVQKTDIRRPDGYFSDSGTRVDVNRTRMHSSTGDLWANRPGPVVRSHDRAQQARPYRLRSNSMSRLERVNHYGTRFSAGRQHDMGVGAYGHEDRPTTFRRHPMYSNRSEPLTPDSVFTDSSDGHRNATIIKLRTPSTDSWGTVPVDVQKHGLALTRQVHRSNSLNYDNYRSKASPTLSIQLGGTHDINISTLPRSMDTAIYTNTREDIHHQNHGDVLSQGQSLIGPAKEDELLHIEIQGADKEWTLKQQKQQKSPSQQSAASSVYVEQSSEQSLVARHDSLKHGTRLEGSKIIMNKTDGLSNTYYAMTESTDSLYRGKVTIPNLGVQQLNVKSQAKQLSEPERDEIDSSRIRQLNVENTQQQNGYYSQTGQDGREVVEASHSRPHTRRREVTVTQRTEQRQNIPSKEPAYENIIPPSSRVHQLETEDIFDNEEPMQYHDALENHEEHVIAKSNYKAQPRKPREININRVMKQDQSYEKIESKDPIILQRNIRESIERVPIQHWDTGLSTYRSSLQSNTFSSSSSDFSISPPVGSAHISRPFTYEPVGNRYQNRNHYQTKGGWNLSPTGSGFRYGSNSRIAPLPQVQEVVDVPVSPGLDKFPDYDIDASEARDINISYEESTRSSGTLTPTHDATEHHGYTVNDEVKAEDTEFSLEQRGIGATHEGVQGEHVHVISMESDVPEGKQKPELQQQESSDIFVFKDNSGAKYDTSISSLLESSKFEAMRELDRMTGSNKGSMQDITEDVQSGTMIETHMLKQDDNNNMTMVNTAHTSSSAIGTAGDDSDDGASSASSDVAVGSYELSDGIAAVDSEIKASDITVKSTTVEMHQQSRQDANNNKELSSSSFTVRSSTLDRNKTEIPDKSASPVNLSPGDVTYQSAKGPRNPSQAIRAAVGRANSKGAVDQKAQVQDELRTVLRLRSVSLEEEQPGKAAQSIDGQSAFQSHTVVTDGTAGGASASKIGTALRIERSDLDNDRSQKKTASQSRTRKQTTATTTTKSGSRGANTEASIESTGEMIRSGSVSSLRQVYKTPPSSLREKKTISVVSSSDIFADAPSASSSSSATTDTKSTKPGYGGKYLMRFREGSMANAPTTQGKSYRVETQTTRHTSTTPAAGILPPSPFRDSHTEVVQDMSLPANEEVHIQHISSINDLDAYLKTQSEDTVSQSSYTSSKLEHFNFELSNDMNTKF